MSKSSHSTVQQICVRCKGTGTDRQVLGCALFAIAVPFIVKLFIIVHWTIGILAIILCFGRLCTLWYNSCKVCNGTGTVTNTSTITVK